VTAAWVGEVVGVPGLLDDLRAAVKDGSFGPLPVRERKIPKPGGSGKLRRNEIWSSPVGDSRKPSC
jgi:RNA-directed DNA polymerase